MRPFDEDGGLGVVRSGGGKGEGERGRRLGQEAHQTEEQQGGRRIHRVAEVQRQKWRQRGEETQPVRWELASTETPSLT